MPLSLSASMRRWKPSVSSRSPAAAAAPLCAGTAISLPPGRSLLLSPCPPLDLSRHDYPAKISTGAADQSSIQIHVAIDVLAQPQRVLAYKTLGSLGVARLERRNDLLVAANRPLAASLPPVGAWPMAAGLEEEPVVDLPIRR